MKVSKPAVKSMQKRELTDSQQKLNQAMLKVALDRDKEAFAYIFTTLSDKLRSFAMTKLNSEALARELVQDTLMTVWRKASMYNVDKGAASTWIYTIARNLAFDMLRRNRGKENQVEAETLWPILSDEHQDRVGEQDFADLDSANLQKAIAQLPEKQREVVELIFFSEMTQQQAADQLSIPVGTVKSRLRLALTRMRGTLL